MKAYIEIKDGIINHYGSDKVDLKDGVYEVNPKNMDIRTIKQNSAMHKYFDMLSTALNDGGYTVKNMVKIEYQWTETTVKDILWRSFQKALTNKESTTKLTIEEVTKVYDNLNLYLSEKYGISVEFPSLD